MGFDDYRKSCASLRLSLSPHQNFVTSSGAAGIFGVRCEQSQWLPPTPKQVKNNEMDGACGGRGAHRVWWGDLRERDHLEDLGEDMRIILNGYSRSGMGRCGLD